MDEALDAVEDQYVRFPFPAHYKARVESIEKLPALVRPLMMRRLKAKLGRSKKYARVIRQALGDDAAGKRILDAGCGTGELTTSAACQIPEASFLGLDLSKESVLLAEELRACLKLENLRFEQGNLLELPKQEPFDMILSIGCLHHLSDPVAGLRSLKDALAPGGSILVFLYSSLGRFDVVCKRKGLDLLIPGSGRFEEKLKTIEALDLFPAGQPRGWYRQLKAWVRNDVGYGESDSVKVDQLAHVQETNYLVEEVFNLLDDAGLVFDRFFGAMPNDMSELTKDPAVLAHAAALAPRDRYRVLELLVRPMDYTFLARKVCV